MTWDVTKFVALDLETYQVEPGLLAPRLVCGSTARPGVAGELLDRAGTLSLARSLLAGDAVLVGANIAYDMAVLAVEDPDLIPLIFAAYETGRVFDVQLAQALHAVAEGNLGLDPRTWEQIKNRETGKRGRYSLDTVVEFVLGRVDAKVRDRWRRRYAVLEGWPIEAWPWDARQYPVDDAVNTLEVAVAQVSGGGAGPTPGPHRNLEDLADQARAAFALHLSAVWGIRTDRERVESLRAKVDAFHRSYVERFSHLGLFRADGEVDTAAVKRAVARAYGTGAPCPAGCVLGKVLNAKGTNVVNCKVCSGTGLDTAGCPKTPKGGVQANQDVMRESGDPDLVAFADNEPEKVRSTYLPFVADGVDRPITLRPNPILSSGRTSYDGLFQLLPHDSDPENIASYVRPCIVARPGRLLCSVDYAALELCTLAQVCLWLLGRSQMAETINATGDPGSLHTAFAARLAGVTAEEMAVRIKNKDPNAKKYRQAAKAGNFGFPGGMGAAKFVFSKRKKSEGVTVLPDGTKVHGIRFCVLLDGAERCGEEKVTEWKGRECPAICRRCAEVVEDYLRPAWFQQWPEIKPYFAWVSRQAESTGEFPCLGTYRVRGRCGFTDGANNGFQALGADAAKRALWRLTQECYLDRSSPLFGARVVMFVHDECILEMDAETAHVAGPRQAEVMVAGARELVEDVVIKAEPALMTHLYKEAETVYRDGLLVPWEPRT